ncbi:hypothetical protein CERSUDRAFT_99016 [Gelatoporia subvermispora B]|uniref:C2H2-type domain-containing protein n=1 Tax=Ceriporiopsis subvermispora (strain B) TaxID=914234 RepID=M2R486_CERS8|nr:hypothetical protein CERSUDRAFT_99016 [Gelatoporia subvermispora B]
MNVPETWTCNWNWCPQAFTDPLEFSRHVEEAHFKNILKVREKDWGVYLRVHEGQSGTTDSLLAGIPSQLTSRNSVLDQSSSLLPPPLPSRGSSPHPHALTHDSREIASSRSSSPEPQSEPSPLLQFAEPANDDHEIASSRDSSASPEPAPSSPASLPARAVTPPRQIPRPSSSFTSFAALSSPHETPVPSPVPVSPALCHLVSDAIGSVARAINSSVGSYQPTRSARAMQAPSSPLPLPRGLRWRSPLTPEQPPGARSPAIESVTSAQDVENQLTQLEASPSLSNSQSRSHSASHQSPQSFALKTQAPYQSPFSSMSQGVPANLPAPAEDTNDIPRPSDPPPRASPPKARLPLPRRTRSRQRSNPPPVAPPTRMTRAQSRTPAPEAAAEPVPPTAGRTLRSRSKTPSQAPARPPPPPLPRRRPPTRRTPEPSAIPFGMLDNALPAGVTSLTVAGTQSVETDLMSVDSSAEAPSSQHSTASFRSGKLELPGQPVTNGAGTTMLPIPEEDDMYADPEPVTKPSARAQERSELSSEGSQFAANLTSQSFGYGFMGSLPLQTQAPYRSQSQTQ